MVKSQKKFKFHVGIGTEMCQQSTRMGLTTPTMANLARQSIRPYIIQPKKRHNYRNLIAGSVLVPLAASTSQFSPLQAKNRVFVWKWCGGNLFNSPPPAEVYECNQTSALSANSREEQASATKAPIDDRKGKPLLQEGVPLTDAAIETAFAGTKTKLHVSTTSPTNPSALNPLSPVWTPSHLNAESPVWVPYRDPWGNVTNTHTSAHPTNWSDLDPNFSLPPTGLSVNTAVEWLPDDAPNKYTPTNPEPCFPTPSSCYDYHDWWYPAVLPPPNASTTKHPKPHTIIPTRMATKCLAPAVEKTPTCIQLDRLRTCRLIPVLHSHSDLDPEQPDAMTLEVLKKETMRR
jgi:hypothetical protein